MDQNCQAIVEDYENPKFRATRQRITVPGSKPCSRKATEKVRHLCVCTQHGKLAREGYVAPTGEVVSRNDIREYRAKIRRKPKLFTPPHNWATVEAKTEAGRDVLELMDGWNTVHAAAKREFPNASAEEQQRIAQGVMTHALGLK